MYNIIQNIIIKQNEALLKDIAKKLNIDEKYLLKKYHISTYYNLYINKLKNYPLRFVDKI
jgi:hypothetical protein